MVPEDCIYFQLIVRADHVGLNICKNNGNADIQVHMLTCKHATDKTGHGGCIHFYSMRDAMIASICEINS